MQDYNLTAELKKIATGVTQSDPNTELGNINGSVGNLDTAMQGVATAIGNINIPNTGSNIDGVATAINNKTIPDPNTALGNIVGAIQNIPDTTNALGNIVSAIQALGLSVDTSGLVALDGSNNSNNIVSDCNDYLTGIFLCDDTTANMPSGQSGVANPKILISIYYPNASTVNQVFISHNGIIYTRQYFLNTWSSWTKLSAGNISYTDNNNIGATDVQGAVDYAAAKCKKAPAFSNSIMQSGASKTITIAANKTVMLCMNANTTLYKVTMVSGVYNGVIIDLSSAGDISTVTQSISGGVQSITITANATMLLSVIATDNAWTIA